jgi:putative hydrolase of the HAD superfamily
MKSDDSIRLVCFDLGRVLVRICENWQHAGEVARLPAPLPQLTDSVREQLRQTVCDSEIGAISLDEFCSRSGRLFGVDPLHIRAVSDIYLRGCYDGVGDVLDELHRAGYQTGCLSNTNDNHWRIMFETGGAEYAPLRALQHRFGSQLVGARKPDPRIYEHVERAVNLKADQILFFDDLAENIEAARRRGWHAELILHDGEPMRQVRGHLRRIRVLPD